MPDSVALSVKDSWKGFEAIKQLVIFGDSFSSVGYTSKDVPPSKKQPLGVPFPGITSCERVDDVTGEVACDLNWVGYLVQTVNSERKSDPLLVYDYAVPGDTIARMKLWQVKKEFMPTFGQHPEWAPWTSSDTLIVTWIGINDCTWNIRLQASSAQAGFDDLGRAHKALYEAGARNFCLMDIPPCHTFPQGPKTPRAKDAFDAWNPMLREFAEKFCASYPDSTVLIFSSWEVFSRVLSDPRSVGFDEAVDRNSLFVDGFHPSSQVHALLAKEILDFLVNVPPTTLGDV